MAQGDVVFFDDAWERIHENTDLELDVFKIALVTAVVTPTAADAGPAWSGGTTNYSTNEVTPGGTYSAGGAITANNAITQASGVVTFDSDIVSWLQNASNPNNAKWGILYDDTTTIKYGFAFIDLGTAFDMTTGDLSIDPHASGWFTES